MPEIIKKLEELNVADPADREVIAAAVTELRELKSMRDALEEILIVLVRTGVPWDEEGRPNENFDHFRERYHHALHEAAGLLGLDLRSTITRTEPRT
ncbi:hypothetical protein L4X63_08050 [Geomonas sp. Red32]|uniref:hypothetical protein n=1 Tax=Geomonas sp. Red32 TaxID=2912856 RepID=UPI00202CC325|nr:hypothetical protein [Geomonas sp. Red32]MCM0081536.1 hypothetical protein [Geomonas sp. Red32]